MNGIQNLGTSIRANMENLIKKFYTTHETSADFLRNPNLMKPLSALSLMLVTTCSLAQAAELPKQLLEEKCLSCHYPDKKKGELDMSTRETMLEGGDAGPALFLENPEKSEIVLRVKLPHDDDDIMPPDGKGKPLTEDEIKTLVEWIKAGAPWPEGVVLAPADKKAMPPHDAPADPTITKIEAFPKAIKLETNADFHKLIAIAYFDDAATRDITRQVKLTLADPSIAQIKDTTLTPLKDGATELLVEYRGLSYKVPVSVVNAAAPRPVSFQLDVMPVLTSAGCNSGSCHGAASGKDGFHLSLYGFDPHGDHFNITTQLPGRRINLALPDESLMITKAVGDVPHTGGKLFAKGSSAHKIMLEWIKNGAGIDDDTKIPHPTGIKLEPPEFVLKGKDIKVPLIVTATYSDGTDRDVTNLCSFTSSNDNSASIDYHKGVATSKNRGEAFLLARFHTFTEGTQAIVIPEKTDYVRPDVPSLNYIDDAVFAKLNKLRIIPSELCSDIDFLRRASIDIIGELPTIEERAAFLADTNPKKREALVDSLIARKEFSEMWTMKWAELLQIRTFNDGPKQVSYKAALNYYNWLRDRISSNTPFNQIINEILGSQGGTFSQPATNFFQIEQDVLKLTENIAQVFMGTRIQCAQCHNHPFDRWTMEDYYGFASFFAQVKRKNAEDPRERIVFDGDGEVPHLVTKKPVPPKFLGGPAPDLTNQTRRQAVAGWLAAPDNPWFARNVANITWSHFFGIGIVDPVDDMRITNPASNPELLDALSKHFVEYNFDIKKLVRDICTSRTYQLSSRTNATNATDDRNFSHSLIRRIRAEVLLDAISQVTGTPNKFKGLPLGARAVQIADGNTSNYFLTTFGRATRATVCSCEVKLEPNLSQALHLLNGDNTHNRVNQGKIIQPMLDEKKSHQEIIEHLYLRALCRPPTEGEMKHLNEFLAKGKDEQEKREILNDIFWSILNSKEFIFNH
jgi:hypothetical protein